MDGPYYPSCSEIFNQLPESPWLLNDFQPKRVLGELIRITGRLQDRPEGPNIRDEIAYAVTTSSPIQEVLPVERIRSLSIEPVCSQYSPDELVQYGFRPLALRFGNALFLKFMDAAVAAIRESRPDFSLAAISLTDDRVFTYFEDVRFADLPLPKEIVRPSFIAAASALKPRSITALAELIAVTELRLHEDLWKGLDKARRNFYENDGAEYEHPLREAGSALQETHGILVYRDQLEALIMSLVKYDTDETDRYCKMLRAPDFYGDVVGGLDELVKQFGSQASDERTPAEREQQLASQLAHHPAFPGETVHPFAAHLSDVAKFGWYQSDAIFQALIVYRLTYLSVYFPAEWKLVTERRVGK